MPEESKVLITKRPFKKFTYRGFRLDQLLDMRRKELPELMNSRARRRISRRFNRRTKTLLKKLRKAKMEADKEEAPAAVRTHLRDVIILPEMVGSIVDVYNGQLFKRVEIMPEMIGHYLGEFSPTCKLVVHNKPGIGATASSRFIPPK